MLESDADLWQTPLRSRTLSPNSEPTNRDSAPQGGPPMSDVVNTGDKRSDAKPPDTRGHLRGNLGVPAIVLMVVAAAAPLSTVGGNVPIAMALGDSAGIPVAFLVAGVIFLLFAASFVAMSK